MSRLLEILKGIVAELSDQNAYQRYLTAHGESDCPAAWRRFQDLEGAGGMAVGMFGGGGSILTTPMLVYIGGFDPKAMADAKAAGKPLPVNHSPFFAPVPEPSIRTGVEAMTLAVMNVMSR